MSKENKEPTLYEILGISPLATLRDIKIAYRKKAMEIHPDVNKDMDMEQAHIMMCKINEAYSVLRDIESRILYDDELRARGEYFNSEEVAKRDEQTSEQDNPQTDKTQNTTKKHTYSSHIYDDLYNYYNTVDFDIYEKEEFIDWLEEFSEMFIRFSICYFNKIKVYKNDTIDKLYTDFDNIIEYEKNLFKNNTKRKTINKT